ncbi:hypothetical protein PsorP6_015949 [Peronosclerospora sorghi]|uniref:Uncharacterized protein n=1 Tax=Peronosclerospora sorghi TaxID=230839 RepID=A0ACC0WP35_9STRA|nr:hypothetical protein PsorP6_015949 [Peronosclerospora sorghi]
MDGQQVRRMSSFLPALLLRSLERFTHANDAHEDETDAASYSTVASGSLVGTRKCTESNERDNVLATHDYFVWGLVCPESLNDDDRHCLDQYLPGGISPIGIFMIVRTNPLKDDMGLEVAALEAVGDVKEKHEIVLVYDATRQMPRMFHCKDREVTRMELNVVPCLHAHEFHRAIGFAPLRCAIDLHVTGGKQALLDQLNKCKAATRDVRDFYVRAGVTQSKKGRRLQVLNGHGEVVTASNAAPVLLKAILSDSHDEAGAEATKKKKKHGNKPTTTTPIRVDEKLGLSPSLEYGDIATVELLVSLAPVDARAHGVAPKLSIPAPRDASQAFVGPFHAHCDALVMVPRDASIDAVLALLRDVLQKQLVHVSHRLEQAAEAVRAVAIHQFSLMGAAFPLTLCSSSTTPDFCRDETTYDVDARERLHDAFFQPLHQPLFRVSRGCSLAQQAAWLRTSDVLCNVHEGIPNSPLSVSSQRQVAVVDGFYGYYHYLQQGINDKGWGCAYRSLQTLASWFFLQHYTRRASLSHAEIQAALVHIGDKAPRFQGSSDWIGSFEVGYVLDELYGVTFRSLSVASGAPLADVAHELLAHFQTQGTPVMMGGGHLAFTLLGVEYDPETRVCAFLTLDPHYIGAEDLSRIQTQIVPLEGYKAVPCSWRKTTSFATTSVYNFCLPQRPRVGV